LTDNQELQAINADLKRVELDVQYIKTQQALFNSSQNDMKLAIEKLVTIDRFSPVAYIAYGLAGGVLTTALGAVLSLVFIK